MRFLNLSPEFGPRRYGDPTSLGPYAIEIRVPPHMRIAAHSHRDDRSGIVTSGAWYFGYGARVEDSKFEELAVLLTKCWHTVILPGAKCR